MKSGWDLHWCVCSQQKPAAARLPVRGILVLAVKSGCEIELDIQILINTEKYKQSQTNTLSNQTYTPNLKNIMKLIEIYLTSKKTPKTTKKKRQRPHISEITHTKCGSPGESPLYTWSLPSLVLRWGFQALANHGPRCSVIAPASLWTWV